MSTPGELQSDPIATLRGRPRKRPRGNDRGRTRVRVWALMCSLWKHDPHCFPTVFRSSVESVNLSLFPENLPPTLAEPLIPVPFGATLRSSSSRFRSTIQTELVKGFSDRTEIQIERI